MTTAKFDDKELWKAIVLYGLNTATYKMGLGKALLSIAASGKTKVEWMGLASAFFDQYYERLSSQERMPQQGNPSRMTVMERIIRKHQLQQISREQAILDVAEQGLNDVIPRFQKIGADDSLVQEHFYRCEFGKKLYLNDSLFKIHESDGKELETELNARWSLLEGAFSIKQGSFQLNNDLRDIYLESGYQRKSLTANIPFLQGYQANLCFYCGEFIQGSIHVDHVLPRQVVQHDHVWNLVLSHDHCNLNKQDSLVGLHYLEKLYQRNENIMGSNHPWKQKIEAALGNTPTKRRSTLQQHYDNVRSVIGPRYWEGTPHYNREHDLFFRKLITQLNNGSR